MSDEFDPIILPKDDSGGGPNLNPQQPADPKGTRGCILLALIALLLLIAAHKILNTPWMASLFFAAVFLLCGIAAVRQERQSIKPSYRFGALFISIGAAMAVSGLALTAERFGLLTLPKEGALADRIRSVVFIVIGIGMIAFVLAGYFHKRRWCTERVEATCVELVQVRSRRGRVSQVPVYEFFCGGATHLLRGNTASTSANPHVGETRMIYVDPVHLDEMYDPKPYYRMLIFPCLFGALFIALGIWLMTLPPIE